MPEMDQENQNQNGEVLDTSGNDNNQQSNPPVPEWQQALFETNARIRSETEARQRAEDELAQLRQQQNNNNNQQQPLDPNVMLQDPERFRQTLNQDMQRQVEPLNDFVAEARREKLYWTNKANLGYSDQRIGLIMQQLGRALDSYFLSNQKVGVTEQDIRNYTVYLVGEFAITNGLGGNQQNNNQGNQQNNNQNSQNSQNNQNNNNRQQNNNQRDQMIPPHIRPTNRPGNSQNQQDAEPDLTEQERVLARKDGMTPREFVALRDAPPHKAQEVWQAILAARKPAGGK